MLLVFTAATGLIVVVIRPYVLYERERAAIREIMDWHAPLFAHMNHFSYEPLQINNPLSRGVFAMWNESPETAVAANISLAWLPKKTSDAANDNRTLTSPLKLLQRLRHLRHVYLSGGELTLADMQAITRVPALQKLTLVNVEVAEGPELVDMIAKQRNLTYLDVCVSGLDGALLGRSGLPPDLKQLYLTEQQLLRGGQHLVTHLARLQSLVLLSRCPKCVSPEASLLLRQLPRTCLIRPRTSCQCSHMPSQPANTMLPIETTSEQFRNDER
jgi:hypothetical protein